MERKFFQAYPIFRMILILGLSIAVVSCGGDSGGESSAPPTSSTITIQNQRAVQIDAVRTCSVICFGSALQNSRNELSASIAANGSGSFNSSSCLASDSITIRVEWSNGLTNEGTLSNFQCGVNYTINVPQ